MDTCGWDASCRPTERGGEVKREVKENKPTSHEYVILLRLRIKSSHRTIGPLTDTISIFSLSLSLPRNSKEKEKKRSRSKSTAGERFSKDRRRRTKLGRLPFEIRQVCGSPSEGAKQEGSDFIGKI